ncbi:MAG: hypothetical protein QF561_05740 [Phycisphaerales bacterium]|nr:hypothetical protein [Phycisphaerales bacterium]
MTWAEVDHAGGIGSEAEVESVQTPFSRHRRTRVLVMSLVVGGGLAMIAAMRMLSGGPAQTAASTEAQVAISAYLSPPKDTADLASSQDPLRVLRQFQSPIERVPYESLRGNPFILPDGATVVPVARSQTSIDDARNARAFQMREEIGSMRVSMVLQGRSSLAVVGGITLPLEKAVEYDAQTTLVLKAVTSGGVVVEATDTALSLTVAVDLPRP